MNEKPFALSTESRGKALSFNSYQVEVGDALYRRRLPDLSNPSSWTWLKSLSIEKDTKADLFQTAAGRKVVVRTHSEIGQAPLESLRGYTKLLTDAVRLRIRIERPLGLFSSTGFAGIPGGHAISQVHHVSAYEEGQTLAEKAGRCREWPATKRIELAGMVVREISYAHSKGALHNHLHAKNILFKDGSRRPVILDPKFLILKQSQISLNDRVFDLSRFTRDAGEIGLIQNDNELRRLLAKYYYSGIPTNRLVREVRLLESLSNA